MKVQNPKQFRNGWIIFSIGVTLYIIGEIIGRIF